MEQSLSIYYFLKINLASFFFILFPSFVPSFFLSFTWKWNYLCWCLCRKTGSSTPPPPPFILGCENEGIIYRNKIMQFFPWSHDPRENDKNHPRRLSVKVIFTYSLSEWVHGSIAKGILKGDSKKHRSGNDLKSFILSVVDSILELLDYGKHSQN